MFLSGFGFAASYCELPDIGFIAWPDMVSSVQRLRLALPQQHLLVDIDDGYVGPEVACHVVEHLERIGASGVILEDQKQRRRCGHVTGKQILPIEEYLEKLNLVLQNRSELVVVARTMQPRSPRFGAEPRRWQPPTPTFCWSTVYEASNRYARCAALLAASRCCSTKSRAVCHPTVADRAGGAWHQRGDLLDTMLVNGAHRDGQRPDRTARQ